MKTLCKFYMAIPFGLLTFNVQAAEAVDTTGQGSSWFYMEQDNGLITNVPAAENHELIGSVRELKQSLSDRKEVLSNTVQEKKFKPKDAVITAVMPGGFLYASYKMMSYNNAKAELVALNSNIEELTMDMVRLTKIKGDAQVAMLY